MKILIKNAKVIDEESSYHGKVIDILIKNGQIETISNHIEDDSAKIIQYKNLKISQGWVDFKANFCDPGTEHKEDINTGMKAAALGGFTHVGIVGSTTPVIDGKSQLKYIDSLAQDNIVKIHVIGAITKNMKGESLAEMYDMHTHGINLFSDDGFHLSSGILLRSLLYVDNFKGTIISCPNDPGIASNGIINEGLASIRTGLKAIPRLAETIQLERDISILEYTGGSLHISGISCAESVELLKNAKQKELNITVDVHSNQLIFNELDILEFDTNHKVMPPYRTEEDQKALINGVKDGTIDAIVSNHRPQNKEEKEVEFDHASFGTISLQTVFSSLIHFTNLSTEKIVHKLSNSNRKILRVKSNPIEVGGFADMTLFNDDQKFIFTEDQIVSKSSNSPFINKEMTGFAYGIIRGDKLQLNSNKF